MVVPFQRLGYFGRDMVHFRQKSEPGKAAFNSAFLRAGRLFSGDRPALGFFAAALIMGGAGVAYPLLRWAILMSATGAVALVLSRHSWTRLPGIARAGIWLAGGYWSLLCIQVLPLPQEFWESLPGHAVAADVSRVAGVRIWRAWSLAPARTLENLLDVLPPLAGLLLLATAPGRRRLYVIRMLVAIAVFNALLGVTQFGAGADTAPLFYGTTHRGVAVGLFVNRNHTAVFLMIAMLLAVLPGVVRFGRREEGPSIQAARAALVGVLALAVLATLSRSGVFLLPVALVAAFMLASTRRSQIRTLAIALLGCVTVMALIAQTPPVRALLQRYASAADDARFDYWANTWLAVRDAFPLGTGFGTFQNVYRTFEPLNQVGPLTVNRAHNDFIEILQAAGIAGAGLLLAALGTACFWIVAARRGATSRFERRVPLAVAVALALIAGSSVVDYPLHGAAMATIAGALLGLLGKRGAVDSGASTAGRRSPLRYYWNAGLAILAVWGSAVCWSQHLMLNGHFEQAVRIQPLNARGWGLLANARQAAGDAAGTSRAARHALALEPLDAGALRAEAAARIQQGDEEGGGALLSQGARLGWRDTFTQVWLVQQALAAGSYEFAVQRIDALLRMRTLFKQTIALLPPLISQESGRRALAEQMGFDPGWRASFFNSAATSTQYELADLLALLAELNKGPVPARPEETALIRAVLGDQGRFEDARRIWLASGGKGDIADPGFERQDNFTVSTGPYVWQAAKLTGVGVRSDPAAVPLSGRAVAISSSGVASGAVLTQTIALKPGRYRIGVSVLARDAGLARSVGLALECLGPSRSAQLAPGSDRSGAADGAGELILRWHQRGDDVAIATGVARIDENCIGQRLAITIPAQDSGPYSLWIDDVVVNASNSP